MAEGKSSQEAPSPPADAQLFGLLSSLLQQVSAFYTELGINIFLGLKDSLSEFSTQFSDTDKTKIENDIEQSTKVGAPRKVESLTNQEEVELRAKIEALGSEVTKVPSKSAQDLDEIEIAKELDKLSSKLDDVDKMISSDPEVRSLLSSTADVWMPVITANSNERRNFTATFADDNHEVQGKDCK